MPPKVPRAPLSHHMASDVMQAVGHCELASSPARLVLCGQTIVVHREELLVKARRSCVLPPDTTSATPAAAAPSQSSQSQPASSEGGHGGGGGLSLNQHLVKSVVDQAHLCPLPPSEAAVYWQLDHALWLHPAAAAIP